MSVSHPVTGLRPCSCGASQRSRRTVIAVTGGPGSGKTALLAAARQRVCSCVALIPEAATILFGGGFWRLPSAPALVAAQTAIFAIQRGHEAIVAAEPRFDAAISDRGTLDGAAYWPASGGDFWEAMRTTRDQELARYDAVVHLRTPLADRGYDRSANPERSETAYEAQALDERILAAWDGHPRRCVLAAAASFPEKIAGGLEALDALLAATALKPKARAS